VTVLKTGSKDSSPSVKSSSDKRNRFQIDGLEAVECIKSWDLHPIGFLKAVVSGALAEVVPGENWDDDFDWTGTYWDHLVQDWQSVAWSSLALPNGYRNETKCLMP